MFTAAINAALTPLAVPISRAIPPVPLNVRRNSIRVGAGASVDIRFVTGLKRGQWAPKVTADATNAELEVLAVTVALAADITRV